MRSSNSVKRFPVKLHWYTYLAFKINFTQMKDFITRLPLYSSEFAVGSYDTVPVFLEKSYIITIL